MSESLKPKEAEPMATNRKSGTKAGGRDERGRFGPGNPGKPPGTRHKATRAVEALLDGEAEALSRKAVEMALSGDGAALRLCLERIAPPRKDSPVSFPLPPMESARDAASAAAAILQAVAGGELTPTEGAHVMGLVDGFRRVLEVTEIEARLTELEAAAHAKP